MVGERTSKSIPVFTDLSDSWFVFLEAEVAPPLVLNDKLQNARPFRPFSSSFNPSVAEYMVFNVIKMLYDYTSLLPTC